MRRRWVTWSIRMPTQFWSTRFLFEINDHVSQFVRKPTFDPLSNLSKTHFWSTFISELAQKWVSDPFESGSKVGFRTNWVTWSLISKINRVDQKWVGMHMLQVTHLLHILYWIKIWTSAYLFWVVRKSPDKIAVWKMTNNFFKTLSMSPLWKF